MYCANEIERGQTSIYINVLAWFLVHQRRKLMDELPFPLLLVICHLLIIFANRQDPDWGALWLSGRVLDSRSKGFGFEPHQTHCVVSWARHFILRLVLVNPKRPVQHDWKIVDWDIRNLIKDQDQATNMLGLTWIQTVWHSDGNPDIIFWEEILESWFFIKNSWSKSQYIFCKFKKWYFYFR